MKTKLSLLLFGAILIITQTKLNAQIATGYQVGTWYQFKPAAVSYTLDDFCSNQYPVALPMFDKYKYKVTFNIVTGWSPNWQNLKTAATNGHEIADHTTNHTSLNTESVAQQDAAEKDAQTIINSNITNAKCLTIAYPNCNIGDVNTLKKYFIAGRICNNQIESSTPSDFFNIGSLICGADGMIKTAANFNSSVTSAKNSKGWCVFLIHGIDGDKGYSSLTSSELSSHLSYMNTNAADFWVGTFLNVAQYIKERNAAAIAETSITTDSLKMTLTDNLDNALYFADLSIRRALPSGWTGARVYLGTTLITSTITTVNNIKYIDFNVAPDKGTIYLANTATTTTPTAPIVTAAINYCQNASATALTATGTALKWYNTATGGTALATAPVPTTTTVGTINYYVSQTVNSIESPRATIAVTVNSTPSAPTVTPNFVCTLNSTAPALSALGTSLKWYSSSTGGTATSTPPVPNTSTIGNTSFYVTQTTGNCESPRAEIIVSVMGPQVKIALKTGWNMIGCPLSTNPDVATAMKSISSQLITIKDLDFFWDTNTAPALNSLSALKWGKGYYIKVSADCNLDWYAK